MKLSKLVDPQFQTTLRKLATQELPLRTAFALKGIIKLCNDELVKYDEVRATSLQQLGDKDDSGNLVLGENNSVKLSEDNMKTFVTELNALLDTDVSIGQIKLADLGDKVILSANDLITLDDLIMQ